GDAVHDPDQLVIGRGDQLVEETPPGAGPGRKRTPNLELSDWGRFGYQQFLHTISGRSRSGRFRILSAAPDATTRGSYIPSYLARLAVRRAARTRPGPAARRCYRRRRDRSGTADTRDRRHGVAGHGGFLDRGHRVWRTAGRRTRAASGDGDHQHHRDRRRRGVGQPTPPGRVV